jgi:hypothetical protein
MALREVFARLGFEWEGEKVKQADRSVKSLTDAAQGLVAVFAGNALLNGVKQFAEELDTLDDLSAQTGIATTQLQELGFAAELSGSSAAEMNSALTLLQKSLGKTSEAAGPQAEALKKLGIATEDAAGAPRRLKDVLPEIFGQFGTLTSEADEARVATDLFGRAGVRLIPTLRRGSAGLKEISADLAEFGGVVGEDTIKQAGEFRDNIARMDRAFFALKGNLATAVFPQLSKVIVAVGKGIGKLSEWTKNTTLADTATKALGVTIGVKLFAALKPFLGAGIKFAAIFLAVDDLLAFLAGKDSVIGRLLDAAFGAGSADVVRRWVNEAIDHFTTFRDSANATFAAIENENLAWTTRALAVMVAFTRDAAAGFPLWTSSMRSNLIDMEIAINEFVLRATETWNAFLGKLHLPDVVRTALEIDTSSTEQGLGEARGRLRAEAEKRTGLREGFGTGPAPGAGVRRGQSVSAEEAAADVFRANTSKPAGSEFRADISPYDVGRFNKAPDIDALASGALTLPKPTLPAGAVAPASNTTTNTIGPTQVTVQVPPGTPTRDANAIGGAAGKAVGASHRNALQSLTQRAPRK